MFRKLSGPPTTWSLPEDLAEICEAEPDTGIELIQIFLTEARDRLFDLRQAVHQGRERDIQNWAHRLRGSCNQLGAGTMACIAERLEVEPGLELFADLEQEFREVEAAMLDWTRARLPDPVRR